MTTVWKFRLIATHTTVTKCGFGATSCDTYNSLRNPWEDEDGEVRQAAAIALGELKDAQAVEPLIAALQDEDGNVRWAAAWALKQIETPEAVSALQNMLRDLLQG